MRYGVWEHMSICMYVIARIQHVATFLEVESESNIAGLIVASYRIELMEAKKLQNKAH